MPAAPAASTGPADAPLVSCLMVTADRLGLARRALRSFQRQTYPNLELVVLDNGTEPVEDLLGDLGLPEERVRYAHTTRTPTTTIGTLRNTSLGMATGAYVVPQWDDDDWSHPERVARQMRALLDADADACTLAGTLMHVDDPAYFYHPFVGTLAGGVPPTIVHKRDDAIRFPDLRRTSDSVYTDAWRARHTVLLPRAESYLYLRYFHGGNLWEQEHFLRRMRNTPRDLLAYGWHRYVRRDEKGHPRFRIGEAGRDAFRQYLADSRAVGLFADIPDRA